MIIEKALKILFKQGPWVLFIKITTTIRQRVQYRLDFPSLKKWKMAKILKEKRQRLFSTGQRLVSLSPSIIPNKWLKRCIKTVLTQVYNNWKLRMVDGHSTEPYIRKNLEYDKPESGLKTKGNKCECKSI